MASLASGPAPKPQRTSSPVTECEENQVPAAPKTQRQSSIRFSEGTHPGARPSMSSQGRPSLSDEVITTRSADEDSDRNGSSTTAALGQQNEARSPPPPQRRVTRTEDDTSSEREKELPWYKRAAEKFGAVSLENKGSVARDHLALERTFLAWVRTSLTFASLGVAITQLFRLSTSIANPTTGSSSSGNSQAMAVNRGFARRAELPFSPLIGHTIPAELVEYLEQYQAPTLPRPSSPPELGPTLLDQLLQLPAAKHQSAARQESLSFSTTASSLSSTDKTTPDAAARLRQIGKPLGSTFVAIAIVIILVGAHRYFEAQHWIIRGKFPASRGSVALVAFVAFALIAASLAIVLAVAPNDFEK